MFPRTKLKFRGHPGNFRFRPVVALVGQDDVIGRGVVRATGPVLTSDKDTVAN